MKICQKEEERGKKDLEVIQTDLKKRQSDTPFTLEGQKVVYKWNDVSLSFFLNGPTPASFSFILGLFKQTIIFFTTNQCEKMSIQ